MNAKFPYKKKFKTIHGSRMAYVDEGVGDPILFLHGNPTSSYLWRNIMPHFKGQGRLIAPDLIGMGDSDKLPNSGPNRYTYVEHRKYLFSLLDELGVNENVTFVIHDWESFPADARPIFQGFRSDAGEKMILEDNLFIEQILPALIRRVLTDEEMSAYRKPFINAGEDRRPTLTFPRQLPIAGEPADIVEIVTAYGNWLTQSQIPKFFVNAEPGTLSAPSRGFIRSLPNVTEITVDGFHYVQEDAPDEIGREISAWLANI